MIVDGIKYERIAGQEYEMRLFEEEEIESYLSSLYKVQSQEQDTVRLYSLRLGSRTRVRSPA